MNGFAWRDLLAGLDTEPFRGPVCLCLDQVLAAADEGDFLLMAALANLGRDVARVCRDPIAEVTICIPLGLARRAMGDAEAAENILGRAQNGLRRFSGGTARQNEAIAALILGILSESGGRGTGVSMLTGEGQLEALRCYSNGLSLLRQACRAHAERGDRRAYDRAKDLCKWAEDRIDGLIPCVYVDGAADPWDAALGVRDHGTNGARPVASVSARDPIWRPDMGRGFGSR